MSWRAITFMLALEVNTFLHRSTSVAGLPPTGLRYSISWRENPFGSVVVHGWVAVNGWPSATSSSFAKIGPRVGSSDSVRRSAFHSRSNHCWPSRVRGGKSWPGFGICWPWYHCPSTGATTLIGPGQLTRSSCGRSSAQWRVGCWAKRGGGRGSHVIGCGSGGRCLSVVDRGCGGGAISGPARGSGLHGPGCGC